uniref:Uncharacterized protein n=1 Tax=Serinus canaria TaxID=9135 RepID=A0A8C9UF95_SERCA
MFISSLTALSHGRESSGCCSSSTSSAGDGSVRSLCWLVSPLCRGQGWGGGCPGAGMFSLVLFFSLHGELLNFPGFNSDSSLPCSNFWLLVLLCSAVPRPCWCWGADAPQILSAMERSKERGARFFTLGKERNRWENSTANSFAAWLPLSGQLLQLSYDL